MPPATFAALNRQLTGDLMQTQQDRSKDQLILQTLDFWNLDWYGDWGQVSYTADEMNLAMSDDTRKSHFTGTTAGKDTELGNKAAEGAAIGGAIGGTIGAIAAAIAAVGNSIALPGLSLVIAGPIAAGLAGAGAGAASGGLIGALVGWNMPEERVKKYE